MAADGSISISTEIDDKKAQAELNRLVKEVDKLNQKLNEKRGQQSAIAADLKEATDASQQTLDKVRELREELDNLEHIQKNQTNLAGEQQSVEDYLWATERLPEVTAELQQQENVLKDQNADVERISGQYEKVNADIDSMTSQVDAAQQRCGELTQRLAESGEEGSVAGERIAEGFQRAQSATKRLEKRIIGLAKRVLIFSVITKALRELKNWFSKVIQTNSEAQAEMARLKGALLALAQPIVQVVIPVFIKLLRIITQVVSAAAQAVAALFGMSAEDAAKAAEALYGEMNALEGVGDAAQDAGKSMASFDEINKLSDGSTGGAGGAGAEAIQMPDFSAATDKMTPELENLFEIVTAIGAALLGWKIASAFTDSLSTTGGVMAIILGLVMSIFGFIDMFNNGMTVENLLKISAGLLLIGVGLSLLTGSWIPLLVAGCIIALFWIAYLTGHGDELIEGLKMSFEGLGEFVTGVFTGDMEKASEGWKKMFDGWRMTAFAVIDSIADALLNFLTWLDEDVLGGMWSQFFRPLRGYIDAIRTWLHGILQFITGVFTGNWELAWVGLQNIAIGFINGLISVGEMALNLLIGGLNSIIKLINLIPGVDLKEVEYAKFDRIAEKVYTPEKPVGEPIQLGAGYMAIPPELAKGTVIPTNMDFLGRMEGTNGFDMNSLTNGITSAITQSLGAQKSAIPGQAQAVMELDGHEIGKLFYDLYNDEKLRVGTQLAGG